MTAYLLVIADREALGWILTARRMAFPSAGRTEVAALTIGDELLLYTTRGAFKNPTRDRGRVIGTASVASAVKRLERAVRFGDREYPVGCDVTLGVLARYGDGVELAPIIDRLEAFAGAGAGWAVRLRRPLLKLSDTDANVIRAALQRRETSVEPDPTYIRWFTVSDR